MHKGIADTQCCLCVLTHVFVPCSEMRSGGLVQSHDHAHQVFAVEDGSCQNVPGCVLCELVDKRAEVLVLKPANTQF